MGIRSDEGCRECEAVERAARRARVNRRALVGGTAATIGTAALGSAPGAAQTPAASPAASPVGSPVAVGQTGTDSMGNPVTMPPDYKGPRLGKIEKLSETPVKLRVFTAATENVSDFTAEANKFTRWYQDQTNVEIEWQVASSVESQAVLTTTLASGDYPDIVMGFSLNRTQELVYGSQGVFVPIEEYLSQAPRLQQVFKDYPDAQGLLTLPDGHIYSMPEINDCFHCSLSTGRLWMYTPWLEELGLAMPATTDEFKAVLQAFNDAGHANALVMDTDSIDNFFGFVEGAFFYRGSNYLRVRDGQLQETLTLEERRESLRYVADLHAAGLFSDENFTRNNDQLRELGNSPEVKVGVASNWYWGGFTDIVDTSLDAAWRNYVAIPTPQGPSGFRQAVWDHYGVVFGGKFMVTDKCQDPALAVRWADGFLELETTLRARQGNIGTGVHWSEPGEIAINDKQALWTQIVPWGELDQSEYWHYRSIAYCSNDFRLGEAVDLESPTFEKALFDQVRENWYPYIQPQDEQPIPFALNQEQADEVAQIQIAIDDYVEQSRAQFTRGEMKVDTDWEAYIENLRGAGLDRWLELNNAAYTAALEASAAIETA